MDIEAVVHEVAQTIQREANVKAVFGDPVTLEDRTVVPVAMALVAIGGGGGGSFIARVAEKAAEVARPVGGGGGGGGMNVVTLPVGFLSEEDGRVVFTAIELPEGEGGEAHATFLNKLLTRIQRGV